MNNISNVINSYVSGYAYSGTLKKSSKTSGKTESKTLNEATSGTLNEKASKSLNTATSVKSSATDTKSSVSGQTIGNPKLSEKAAKYYEELKTKYSNMNFILVSEDEKENAKANAASYGNSNNVVVLIDEDKLERMAEDEDYRNQIEGVISNSASGLSELATSLSATGASIQSFGMQVNDDGTASYFAVLEKSSEAQRARIEKKAEVKKEEKKEAEKEAREEAVEKNRDEAVEKKREEAVEKKRDEASLKNVAEDRDGGYNSANSIFVTAYSPEELLSRVQEYSYNTLSDTGITESELQIGQNIDFCG